MRVLIACECSGVVREAFRAQRHDAYSCDLLPSADKSEYHYRCDALRAFGWGGWDCLIAHPPCDYLTNSAAWAYPDPDFVRFPDVGYHQKVKPGTLTGLERREAREKAKAFFLALWNCNIPRVCIENPIGCMNTHPELPDSLPGRQIIQPYQFGDDASKSTCLWLRGLPPLIIDPTKRKAGRWVMHEGKAVERWANQTDSGQNALPPSLHDRAGVRAITYPGIAQAMAAQWTNI